MLKNKTTQIIIGVVIFLLLLGGGYFLFVAKPDSTPQADQSRSKIDNGPESLSPSEVGLTFTASPNKKQVKFSIDDISDIKAIAYQLTYEADSTKEEISEGGEPKIQRGIIGDAKLKSGDKSYESPWIDLGSASKNVVRYDTGVDSVSLILKITKKGDLIYQVEEELQL